MRFDLEDKQLEGLAVRGRDHAHHQKLRQEKLHDLRGPLEHQVEVLPHVGPPEQLQAVQCGRLPRALGQVFLRVGALVAKRDGGEHVDIVGRDALHTRRLSPAGVTPPADPRRGALGPLAAWRRGLVTARGVKHVREGCGGEGAGGGGAPVGSGSC